MVEINFLKSVKGYPGYYISDTGKIFSNKSGDYKIMATQNINGYLSCTLYSGKGRTGSTCKIHRLVAQEWLENPDNLPSVDHKDGNKENNNAKNLEWVTVKENNKRANKNPHVKCIIQASLEGKFIAEFKSIADASKTTGIDGSAITKVLKKTRRQTGGFLWIYKEEYTGETVKLRKNAATKKVGQYTKKGVYIQEFESAKEAGESIEALKGAIAKACRNGTILKGFKWKYIEKETLPDDETKDWIILDKYPTYKISRDGRIYSCWLKRMKMPTKEDYLSVRLKRNDETHHKEYVHRLVAMAYLPKPEGKEWVNHIDGNKLNNNVENLEWCTPKENAQYAHDTGLGSSKKTTVQYIMKNNNLKEIARFKGLKDAANATSLSEHSISKVCRGIKESHGGFIWRYE